MTLLVRFFRPSAAAGLLAVLALAACTGGEVTAPVTGAYNAPPASTAGGQATAGANEYVTVAGDTVYTVAQRYAVGAKSIVELNQLQPPYTLQPGQRLRIPSLREYIVQSGDTLYGIARKTQTQVSEIARINNLQTPYNIRSGQRLRVPEPVGDLGILTVTAPPSVAPVAQTPSAAQSAIQVTELAPPGGAAKSGTAYTAPPAAPGAVAPPNPSAAPVISTPSAPTAAQLAAPPAIAKTQAPPPPAPAKVGGAPTPLTPPDTAAPIAIGQTPPPGVIPASPPPSEPTPPTITPAPASPAPSESASLSAPKPPTIAAPQGFIWPVKGELISRFGDKGTGLRNDGINIAAPKGTPVVAADNGVVVYSGNELKGFGNLVLIRHPNGWVTAYAHNETLLVARGEQVERGQEIARVGSTGNVTSPQLHFEVRKGGERIDPLSVIGSDGDPKKT